jgi:hypothetical protein
MPRDTDALSNEKIWDMRADSGDFYFVTRNDADNGGSDIFKVTRGSESAVSSFDFLVPVSSSKGYSTSSIYTVTMTSNAGTWDLNQGFRAALSATLTGNATVTMTNPQTSDCQLFMRQDSTLRSLTFSCTGVTFYLYGTSSSGANSLTVPTSQFANASGRYIIDLVFTSATGCAIVVRK